MHNTRTSVCAEAPELEFAGTFADAEPDTTAEARACEAACRPWRQSEIDTRKNAQKYTIHTCKK
jgi:hypothetical protein